MDTVFVELMAFLKANGTALTISVGALWLSRRGDWIWKREHESAMNAQRELTTLWKLRSEKNEVLLYRLLKVAEPVAGDGAGA